jgi:hypothetical protein
MLPKIDVPVYEAILPSNNKTVQFRPFLVKEQKLLLMASQGTDIKETIDSIKRILKNCVLTDIDIDALPVFDLEFLFLNLRARSVNEMVNIRYKCNNKIVNEEGESKECTGHVEYDLNVLDIKPEFGADHNPKIMLSDKLGMVLKYPTFEIMSKLEASNENDMVFELLLHCVDFIFDNEEIYKSKDIPKEELVEFLDNLQQKHLELIKTFFDTMPKVKKDLEFNCPKCGHHDQITIEGVQSFFV